jgi:hypothetical protein
MFEGGADLGAFTWRDPDPIDENKQFWLQIEQSTGWRFSRVQRRILSDARSDLWGFWNAGPDGGPPRPSKVKAHLAGLAKQASILSKMLDSVDEDERNGRAVRVILDQMSGGISATGDTLWHDVRRHVSLLLSSAQSAIDRIGIVPDGRNACWPEFIGRCAVVARQAGGKPGQNTRFLRLLRALIPPKMTKGISDDALRASVKRALKRKRDKTSSGSGS